MISPADWPSHPQNPFPAAMRHLTPSQVFFRELPKLNPMENLTDWTDPRFQKLDIAYAAFLREKGFSDEAVRLLGVNSAYGNTPFDVSMLHIMHYFVWARLQLQGSGRTQCVGGNQRLPEGMRKMLRGDVRLNQRVTALRTDAAGVDVFTADGKKIRGKTAICTLPFTLLRNIDIDPQLTGLQWEAVETLPYYNTYQIHYEVKRPFWEDDGLAPNVWSDAPFDRLTLINGDDGKPACYLAYINGQSAAFLDRMSYPDAEAYVRREIERARPSTKGALKPLRVHSNQLDPFIGGSYAYWSPGMPLRFGTEMAKPHGRILFAGEHTALTNRGMEGAMESGERAALEALGQI
jgi:monoamine oxidase